MGRSVCRHFCLPVVHWLLAANLCPAHHSINDPANLLQEPLFPQHLLHPFQHSLLHHFQHVINILPNPGNFFGYLFFPIGFLQPGHFSQGLDGLFGEIEFKVGEIFGLVRGKRLTQFEKADYPLAALVLVVSIGGGR